MQKIGWFGVVRVHPRSLKIALFDRARTTFYSSLTEPIRLSCTVYEIYPSTGPKSLFSIQCTPLKCIGCGLPRKYARKQRMQISEVHSLGLSLTVLRRQSYNQASKAAKVDHVITRSSQQQQAHFLRFHHSSSRWFTHLHPRLDDSRAVSVAHVLQWMAVHGHWAALYCVRL